jgi:hypothetical protein
MKWLLGCYIALSIPVLRTSTGERPVLVQAYLRSCCFRGAYAHVYISPWRDFIMPYIQIDTVHSPQLNTLHNQLGIFTYSTPQVDPLIQFPVPVLHIITH